MSMDDDNKNLELGGDLTPAVKALVIINVVCFVVQQFLLPSEWFQWVALVPDLVVNHFAVWQLVTHIFMHGGLWHLLFNMLALWVIGRELEFYWGGRDFVKYYFICGIGSAIFDLIMSFYFTHDITTPSIGASGAIYGLLVAFALIFWDRYITLVIGYFLPVTVKVQYLVLVLALIALYSGLAGVRDGVGHFAHLGGMVVGFVYMKYIKPSLRWGKNMFNRKTEKFGLSRFIEWLYRRQETQAVVHQRQQEIQLRERIDLILDKINEVGYENLSDEEKQTLKVASENLNQNRR